MESASGDDQHNRKTAGFLRVADDSNAIGDGIEQAVGLCCFGVGMGRMYCCFVTVC